MESISKHLFFNKNQLLVDFKTRYRFENSLTFAKVFKAIYKDMELDYSKYFKMDLLSKLGFLSSEVLLQNEAIKSKYKPERTGIILGNSASTYLTDSKHQETISNRETYFPSPANFVYTLPNIMTGEICIRNGFKGENAVFIHPDFDAAFLYNYAKGLFETNKLDACILGYVNIDENSFESFLTLIEKKEGETFELSKLNDIFTKYKNITNG